MPANIRVSWKCWWGGPECPEQPCGPAQGTACHSWGCASVAPAASQDHNPKDCCVVGVFQRDRNVALGTPDYWYETQHKKHISNMQWDF
jgi:hypothetical protein